MRLGSEETFVELLMSAPLWMVLVAIAAATVIVVAQVVVLF